MRSTANTAAKALYGRCWDAANRGDLPRLLDLALDPDLTTDMLATIAPSYHERDADTQLVNRVLDVMSREVVPRCGGESL